MASVRKLKKEMKHFLKADNFNMYGYDELFDKLSIAKCKRIKRRGGKLERTLFDGKLVDIKMNKNGKVLSKKETFFITPIEELDDLAWSIEKQMQIF